MVKKDKTDKPEKAIVIEEKETTADLLRKAKATKPTPTEGTRKGYTKAGKKIGRPPKVKKTKKFDVEAYSDNTIAKTLNSFLTTFGNKLLQVTKKAPLEEKEKMAKEDCMIGEATCYTLDYYGLGLDHPIMVMIIAVGAYGWELFDKTRKMKEVKKLADWQEKNK